MRAASRRAVKATAKHAPRARMWTACTLVCALGVSAAPHASARGNAKKTSAAEDKNVAAAKALLASKDHDEIETGIQSLGLIGTPSAAGPIIERVRAGLPPDLLETSIITLMALGQPQAAPLYFELLEYRRPEVRLRAIEAIVAQKPNGAESALQKSLADLDPKVRSAAALALGELRATGSVEVLFKALDRGTFEASQAIGQALRSDHVPRLLGYLGSVPFHHLGPAFTEVLLRKDISERDKLGVVSRLQDVGTREIKEYFAELTRTSGEKLPPTVNRAALRAVQEIAD